ncbi:MAG: DUF5683 domain-containing protein, partial [Bacteroidales bacterium]
KHIHFIGLCCNQKTGLRAFRPWAVLCFFLLALPGAAGASGCHEQGEKTRVSADRSFGSVSRDRGEEPAADRNGPVPPLVSPARAAMLSATLPGLGQVYNRRYWKVPIIYAGFGTLAYFLNVNNTEYQKWRKAYIARVDGNPNTVDGFPLHSTDVMERAMNYYRRNLEVTYLLGAVLYILNILDANVDAHLMDFDVREDLNMRMGPLDMDHRGGVPGTGLTFTLRF